MYNYGYNCYAPCAPVAPVLNNCGRGCGGFAFILVLFSLLAIICGSGCFNGGGCDGFNNNCGCGC